MENSKKGLHTVPINESTALVILDKLIRKPETNGADIPHIWQEIINVYNKHYSTPVEHPKKKRRRNKTTKPMGWPKGVTRQEFKTWKEYQLSKGNTDVNPHDYKRLRDAGVAEISSRSIRKARNPQ
jgi:hypothetical protein